ncbi:MAG: hypothetical protein ABW190_05910 [Rhizobacter sp.]
MNVLHATREIALRDRYAAVHFRECFIDELARAAWRDPVQYRREMLPADSRLRAVLDRAARVSGWSRAPQADVARGVALTALQGAVAAHVAEMRVDDDGDCHLIRMVIVLDGATEACAELARTGIAPAVANALAVLRARMADELDEVAA